MMTTKTLRPGAAVLVLGSALVAPACENTPTVLERHEVDIGYATDIASSSLYLEMEDGVRIAIDVHLPIGIGDGPFPTLLEMTRYWRDRGIGLPYTVQRAVNRGFVYVIMDERGTGASFGRWPTSLTDRALEDGRRVLDWIVDQPWSNGYVGATGVSYPGMAAQQLGALGHPALRAVVPMSDSYDLYEDLVFPGGMYNEAFMSTWSDIVALMDRSPEVDLGSETFRLQPVDTDGSGALLAEAQGQHGGNLHVHQAVQNNVFRDDQVIPGVTLDDMSTLSRVDVLSQSGAATYRWASWLDAGSADGAIRQFMENSGPQRAVIGAWSHDLETNTSPFMQVGIPALPRIQAQWDEALNFFQDILVKRKPLQGRIFRYMNLTTGEWKSTSEWPIPGTSAERFYLSEDGFLKREAPTSPDGEDTHAVTFESRSSDNPRWLGPLFGDTWYENRRWEDEDLLVYQTLPLTEAIEVTGYPVIHLNVASSHSDGAFIVYLEDVDQYGRVRYVTEGVLRAIHRKVSADPSSWKRPTPFHSFRSEDARPMVPGEVSELAFGLHPTSVLFQVGHRIRISIAGHDASAFRRVPESGTPEIRVQRNSAYPSYIELPVIR